VRGGRGDEETRRGATRRGETRRRARGDKERGDSGTTMQKSEQPETLVNLSSLSALVVKNQK